jgi:hypothetical protein
MTVWLMERIAKVTNTNPLCDWFATFHCVCCLNLQAQLSFLKLIKSDDMITSCAAVNVKRRISQESCTPPWRKRLDTYVSIFQNQIHYQRSFYHGSAFCYWRPKTRIPDFIKIIKFKRALIKTRFLLLNKKSHSPLLFKFYYLNNKIKKGAFSSFYYSNKIRRMRNLGLPQVRNRPAGESRKNLTRHLDGSRANDWCELAEPTVGVTCGTFRTHIFLPFVDSSNTWTTSYFFGTLGSL